MQGEASGYRFFNLCSYRKLGRHYRGLRLRGANGVTETKRKFFFLKFLLSKEEILNLENFFEIAGLQISTFAA